MVAVTVEGLRKTYGDVAAVDGLSFTIEHREVFALVGPNGAGKTTAVEILEGHRRRTSGTVDVLGFDPERGANYVLAGLVVVAASGQDYADYLQQHVLAPLGMNDTFVLEDPAVAQGHQYWFGFAAASGPTRRTGMVAVGYLASTADDLGRYLLMFLRGGTSADGTRLLSPGGIRTLSAPGPEAHLGPWADGGRARYAMGWMVGGPWAEPAVFHPGNSPDSSAMIALFPERELAAATLVPAAHELPLPGNPSITDRISRNTLHAVLGEPVPPATSVWEFYLWFDAAAIGQVPSGGVAVFSFVRVQAVSAGRSSAPISGSRVGTMLTRQRARTSRPR